MARRLVAERARISGVKNPQNLQRAVKLGMKVVISVSPQSAGGVKGIMPPPAIGG
jgi:hypothetical protein